MECSECTNPDCIYNKDTRGTNLPCDDCANYKACWREEEAYKECAQNNCMWQAKNKEA